MSWPADFAIQNPEQASGTAATKGLRRCLCGHLMILACSVFMLPVIFYGLQPLISSAPAEPLVTQHSANTRTLPRSRTFLRDGSIYQNERMTLWSASGIPISVTLRIFSGSEFNLLIDNLNSADGSSMGWIAMSGTFVLEEQPAHTLLVPKLHYGTQGLQCDNLDRASWFAYRFLSKVGSYLLGSALHMQLDIQRDEVYVAPRASVLRVLWDEPVVLRLTSPNHLWKP